MLENNIIETLSESRLSALAQFASNIGADVALLLLTDDFGAKTKLSVAYAIGLDEEELRGISFDFPYEALAKVPVDYFHEIGIRLADKAQGALVDARWNVLAYTQPVTGRAETFVGIVFHAGQSKAPSQLAVAANLLCQQLEVGRFIRVIEATRTAQQIAQTQQLEEAELLNGIATTVGTQINCERFVICERDATNQWQDIDAQGRIIEFSQPGEFVAAELVKVIEPDYGKKGGALFVPIHRPSIKLKSQSFINAADFVDGFKQDQYTQKAIVFYGRKQSRYLQGTFSEADRRLCNRVFFSVQSALAAAEYQSKTNWTIKVLLQAGDSVFPFFKQLREIISGFDRGFSSVGVLRVLSERDEVFARADPEYDVSILPADYIARIQKSYLGALYEKHGGEAPDGVFIGVDSAEGYFRLEFHFSSHLNETRIFVVRCDNEHVSVGALRGLIHFFTELHVRHKRSAFLLERAAYITQVRHVLVHHVSAALKALSSIQSTWRASARDEKLWAEVRKDPDFPRFVDLGVINMARASKFMEAGRFIIDDINAKSLNRKGINIISIVEDTFKVLNYEREQRRLTVRAKVRGAQPSIMNGDEELLRIAMMNLVDNAIKYSAIGREVTWEIDFKEYSYTFRITSHGNPIRVRDKDILIKTRFRARQLDHLNQRHGTGWGLPVTNKILQAHSPTCKLDFETVIDPLEPINSRNTFFFQMPYRTGTVAQNAE
ncbi:ATP-binding protein [Rhizobium sp. ZPR3]|uniref:histidine kinase n=2 Tax=unclassified Rhizobium TaxID=2613769 RepID=A0AAU7SQ71_9HYPH